MTDQCIDMGISRDDITSHLVETGYWGDSERRRRNTYVLSPAAYAVNSRQQVVLDTLARALYASIESTSHKLCRLARAQKKTHAEAFFVASVKNGVRSLRAPHEHDGRIPPIIKVDLMQDTQGRYMIAEADVYNPRGFGFLALLDATVPPEFKKAGPGMDYIARSLAETLGPQKLTIVVPSFEHFYLPSYEVFAAALWSRGIENQLVTEEELAGTLNIVKGIGAVFTVPDTLYAAPEVRDTLLARIAGGSTLSFYPPAAYLGSKALLPAYAECPVVSRFMPKTEAVSRRNPQAGVANDTALLLKASVSSGHKNIVFSRKEPEVFTQTLAKARTFKNPHWIVQEEVEQQAYPVVVFDDTGKRITHEYRLRLTAYIARDGLVGLEVTGRQDGFVHGAPDCIQIPCVLT